MALTLAKGCLCTRYFSHNADDLKCMCCTNETRALIAADIILDEPGWNIYKIAPHESSTNKVVKLRTNHRC